MSVAVVEPQTKTCSECRETKAVSAFGPNKASKDRLSYYCKACKTARTLKWREKNPERHRKTNREVQARKRASIYALPEVQQARQHYLEARQAYREILVQKHMPGRAGRIKQ